MISSARLDQIVKRLKPINTIMQLSKSFRYTMALTHLPSRCCAFLPMKGRGMIINKNNIPAPGIISTTQIHRCIRTTALCSERSSFVPPEPPTNNGQAMFPNINMLALSSQSTMRNTDSDAVFVITGASRGIGLQIVKDMLGRTKVCLSPCHTG